MRKPVLLTLAWRWRTLAWLPQWVLVAVVLSLLFRSADRAMVWCLRETTGRTLERHASADGVSGIWFAGMALGFVLAWSAHELLRCPITATIPRLRRALAIEVTLVLAAAAVLFLFAARVPRSTAEVATVAAVGFSGGGVGVLVSNPSRFRTWSAAIGLVLVLFAVGEILEMSWPWPRDHVAVAIPALVALGIAAIVRAFSLAEHRTYLADPVPADRPEALTLDMSHRDAEAASWFAPVWRGGRDWTRATLHEMHGAGPFGWRFEVAKYLALFVVLLVVVIGHDRPRGTTAWYQLAQNALGESPGFWRVLLSFWLLVIASWAASVPTVPRLGFVRPASRSERARSAWSVAVLRAGSLLGGVTVFALALGSVAAWRSAAAGDRALRVEGAPDLLGAIAIVGIVAPWAAWLRLRLLDVWVGSARFPNPLRQGAIATAAVVACEVVGHLLASAWTAAESVHPALAPPLFAAALAGSWLAYRATLDRLFRTVALPV